MGRPDFSGTWTFNAPKSSLQIPAPESSDFVIEHREPRFRLSRTLVMRGQSDTFSIEFTTDGAPFQVRHPRGFDVRGRSYWDGDTLAFDTMLAREDEEATNEVRYRLSADGLTLTAEERFRGREMSYDNVWVLDRR